MSKPWRNPVLIIIAATTVVGLSIGIRQTLGLFLRPMTLDLGWSRESFALAIALQNLLWGLSQPFTGMLADRYGTGRVLFLGGIGYALGLALMSMSRTPLAFTFSVGLINGISISATSFAVVLGAVSRAVPPERRGLAMGIATAGGSIGQFVMLPIGQWFISSQGWSLALMSLAAVSLLVVPFSGVLAGKAQAEPQQAVAKPGRAFRQALRHKPYWLLFSGFFVCGFHVAFIGTHLPAYLVDKGISPALGATALALIGFFNIIGSFSFGMLGGRFSKKRVLSGLYLARTVAILGFVLVPISPLTVMLFSSAMGFLWLGTVPVTSALVGQMFGVRFLSTLFGFVFLGHQMGSFLGVWLGGLVYDLSGSYMAVWYLAAALGVASALLHWPIDERAVKPAVEPAAVAVS